MWKPCTCRVEFSQRNSEFYLVPQIKSQRHKVSYFLETSPYRPMSTLPNLRPVQLYLEETAGGVSGRVTNLQHWKKWGEASLTLERDLHTLKQKTDTLETSWQKIQQSMSHDCPSPAHPVHVNHDDKTPFCTLDRRSLHLVLTSMVLSLKYLIYSGPMYSGGLQVIRKTEKKKKTQQV